MKLKLKKIFFDKNILINKKARNLSFLLILVLLSFTFSDMFSKKSYVYVDKTNGKTTKSNWVITKKNKMFLAKETSPKENTTVVYTEKFLLQKYSLKSAHSDYIFQLQDYRLITSGLTNGRNIKNIHNARGKLWIQDFKFGFINFLKSSKKELPFFIVNPNDFTLNDLVAIKQVIENVQINDKTYKTQKINITLPGLFSHFWKAEIWFDIETKDLIKYKANKGPGTPISVITLEKKS